MNLKVLRKGNEGPPVKALQTLITGYGYPCGGVDGIFGSKTESAVRAYQDRNRLTVDGIVGNQTWGHLLGIK